MIKPYGSNKLVNCYFNRDFTDISEEFEVKSTSSLKCDDDVIIECNRIADGSLTPVDGFFHENDLESLIINNKTEKGYYFPVPILLQVPKTLTRSRLHTLVLKDSNNTPFGILDDVSFYEYDTTKICDFIFGNYDKHHPGVIKFLSKGNFFAGGKLQIIQKDSPLSRYCLSPKESRGEITKRKWKTCVGFQTRNIPHRSHEYLQRIALEYFDGLLIHPIIGWKKNEDYRPEVIMDVYKYLVDSYYPKRKVMLSGLEFQMRYAGPKEAVLHSIIRQNFGCSHFIVGRDHAGVNNYYGKYDAHLIFNSVKKFIDITILKFKGPYYCKKCKCITTENTCGHDARHHIEISGTNIRNYLLSSDYPPSTIIRKDVTEKILEFDKIFISNT